MPVPSYARAQNVRTFSGIAFLAGIWLIISPWVLGYSGFRTATWDDVIFGVVILVLGGLRASSPVLPAWLSWLNALVGLWILVSPWALGHASVATATWSEVITGAIVLVCAAVSAWSGSRSGAPRAY